jgi:hypothetical protein
MERAFLVSLRYNPAHISHLVANYKLFQELGVKPSLIINKKYINNEELSDYDVYYFSFKEVFRLPEPKTIIFWFPSLGNIFLLLRFKIFRNIKIFYVFHEPFDSISNYYKSGFSALKVLKISLINVISLLTASLSDTILLPSQKAVELYKKTGVFFNKSFFYLPLMFNDELQSDLNHSVKKYISYIGTANPDHSFKQFLDFALYAIKNNIFPQYRFLIATKSNLSPLFENLEIKKYLDNEQLFISHNRFMSNKEINQHYLQSVIVWNAYTRTTQSGVLPKAFMFGCPVLSLKKNTNEFVVDTFTGRYVDDNQDKFEIEGAVIEILSNKDYYKNNCRIFFLNTFFFKSMIEKLKSLI